MALQVQMNYKHRHKGRYHSQDYMFTRKLFSVVNVVHVKAAFLCLCVRLH